MRVGQFAYEAEEVYYSACSEINKIWLLLIL